MNRPNDFTLGSLVTIFTLLVGIVLGFVWGSSSRTMVNAQGVPKAMPQIVEVSPTMTAGSIGTNLALIHEVDADQVVVNGIDLLRFDQNLITYLSRRPNAENADLENVINASRSEVIHRFADPSKPAQSNVPQVKK